MPLTANESFQLIGGYDDHHNHAMLVLGIWQAVIAALVFLATIAFGMLNLRTSCTLRSCSFRLLMLTTVHQRK